jgi:hypothetical protein
MYKRTMTSLVLWIGPVAFFYPLLASAPWSKAADDKSPVTAQKGQENPLSMSHAVVCRSIDGYEAYEPLPESALTSDEKLLVYYRPLGFKTAKIDGFFQAHLIEDGQVRKRGGKAVLFQKRKMVDYTAKFRQPPRNLYIHSAVSLKGLAPGEYEFIVTLHDEIAKGPPATQIVKFRVIPATDPRKDKKTPGRSEDQPAGRRETSCSLMRRAIKEAAPGQLNLAAEFLSAARVSPPADADSNPAKQKDVM